MIVLNVTYKCKPRMKERFLEAIIAEGIDLACRSEAGNIQYDYYLPADGGDEILLVEKWRDADALAEHWQQPHMATLKALKTAFVADTLIERFELQQ